MQSTTIRGSVDSALLNKADRLFQNSDDGLWTELLQNARRAGAESVEITLEAAEGGQGRTVVTVWDNGGGIDDFQRLISLGGSGWSEPVQTVEDPAGIGFFSLCRSEVTVESGRRRVNISPAVFLGREEARVETVERYVHGTRLVFVRDSAPESLKTALERVTAFCPLAVWLNGDLLPRYDFLEGALHREQIDGIEVGFALEFKHKFGQLEQNWNFYGARIREFFSSFDGMIVSEEEKPASLHARFNVLETGRVKLQLPDRRAVIQDAHFEEFARKAKGAAYRFFQTLPRHALPYVNWREARELGVALPEAAPLLRTWRPQPADDGTDPVFGASEQHIVPDLSKVWIMDWGMENEHTLAGALESGSRVDGVFYEARKEWDGYAWYQQLPRITGCTVLIDDVPSENWPQGSSKRPGRIEIELRIVQAGEPERRLRLPARIHVFASETNQINFAAVRNSPWDNDDLAGPFSLIDFLMSASFCASDDSDSDSWLTQRDNHAAEAEREVNAYFRGPKATLLALLRKGIGWDANRLATDLGVREIHFKRVASDPQRWEIDLIDQDVSAALQETIA